MEYKYGYSMNITKIFAAKGVINMLEENDIKVTPIFKELLDDFNIAVEKITDAEIGYSNSPKLLLDLLENIMLDIIAEGEKIKGNKTV